MQQEFERYTADDHKVWEILFNRQVDNLKDKACSEYLYALDQMQSVLYSNQVARFTDINSWFENTTGWSIHTVPGLIPVDEFFELLANKKFCSSTWLRNMNQLDYLEEPDMFHDIFGHIPLLANETYSQFIHEFGKLGHSYKNDPLKVLMLQRLYWFTIEFGLIDQNGLKIYGAGILSSFGESNASISNEREHLVFNIEDVLVKSFFTDKQQNEYFVINSFEELFASLELVIKNWNYELVNQRR